MIDLTNAELPGPPRAGRLPAGRAWLAPHEA